MAMFSGFHAYDDEGYFLILLRDYLAGKPLLTASTPIYGPFFFETMGGLFKLLAPFMAAGMRKGNEKALERLKQRLETGAPS